MIHPQSVPFGHPFPTLFELPALRDAATQPLAMIAYRSRAVVPQTERMLGRLLATAQRRNRAEGITGLLIYDDGHFFQWLEGPRAAVLRVFEAIRLDERHRQIEVLREQALANRFFGGWDLRLTCRGGQEAAAILASATGPLEVLRKLRLKPLLMLDAAWDEVFAERVLPQLRLKHPAAPRPHSRAPMAPATSAVVAGAAKWHAAPDTGAVLAHLLLSLNGTAASRYLDDLVVQGAGLEPLFHEAFEPAARCLGRWSDADLCDELAVTTALGRLQIEAHRLGAELSRPQPPLRRERSVLVAPQPGESDMLSASLSSELFWRDGWNVRCEFPGDDAALRDLVRENWFDVLELSSSDVHCREHQLQAMRVSIQAVHAASKNPALAIIVDGRSFHEHPRAYLQVGADCGCSTSIDAVPAALRLLDAVAANHPAPNRWDGGTERAAAEERRENRFLSSVF